MSDIRVLVAEDDERWGKEICGALKGLSDEPRVITSYEEAIQVIRENEFDLIIVDLGLPTKNEASDLPGMELLREIRLIGHNKHCAVIVITGYATIKRVLRATNEHNVYTVIDKADAPPMDDGFADIARSAIVRSWIQKASIRESSRYCLSIAFDDRQLLSSELRGPGRRATPVSSGRQSFDVGDLVRRADLLNWMIEEGGVGVWRDEAQSIGNAIYNAVTADRDIHGNLKAAQALVRVHDDVWLHFSGPPDGLGIPFELMRDEQGEPLALTHIITRHMTSSGTGKTEPFHDFINKLLKDQERLRMLIVGANSDGRIPAAEQEAERLKELIEADLRLLGIPCDIKPLIGMDAQYENVRRALRDGDYHIFHYCGHGHYDETLAERSGLVLRDGRDREVLPASEIHALTRNKRLRLAFLSACTSARTAERAGRGDFHSVFQALAKADVPAVIGYRWAVADRPAMRLAEVFYRELWRSFSPGEAMLKARQDAAQGKLRRDDDTWASPVMLMQNA